MIKYNPLFKSNGTQNGALTTAPSDSIVFDVPGKCIWVKGVQLLGTDHTYSFSHDNYITLTNTPGTPEDIKIGVNITNLLAEFDKVRLYIGENNNTAASALTTNPYIKLFYNDVRKLIFLIRSANDTNLTVTTDSNGNIIIDNKKPDVNHNTDYQVSQLSTTDNNDFRLLLKCTANDVNETTNVKYDSTLTFNPYTKYLKINGLTVIHTGSINSANATISDTLTTIATLGGVEIKAKVDYSNVITSYLSQWDITADKASFELTREWTDSGVGLSGLNPGPCLLYINYCGVHYTGIFAYSGATINTDDEFPLHCSGYTQLGRGRIFAKIAAVLGATKLLLAALVPETNIPLFTIKIKQIAIL